VTKTDSFLIWGHGLQYVTEIMAILREYFDIMVIHKRYIADMPSFVSEVYSIEDFPIRHVQSKTKYLLQIPQEVILVLVKNSHVDKYTTGRGRFLKERCRYNQIPKNLIREKFNPKEGRHNHIIHGTDNEAEVEHLLKLLNIGKDIAYYTRNEGTPFPYHITQKPYTEGVVPISGIRGYVLGLGIVGIEDTPQYQYAIGNKQPYIDYFYKYMGKDLQEDHFPEKFDMMMEWDSFDPVLVNGKRIIDGGKRAAISLARGEENIKAYLINGKNLFEG